MFYYHVWVRSNRFRGKHALTYSSQEKIAPGALVRVPLQKETVHGVVVDQTVKPRNIRAQLKDIEAILPLPPLPAALMQSAAWLQAYYRASIGSVAQTLIPASIPQKIGDTPVISAPVQAPQLPPLGTEQAAAMQHFNGPGSYILHGRTGSGKTRLYQELAWRELSAGRSVMILSPEISLTSQLAASFKAFGDERVLVLHSAMTNAERFKAWRTVAAATTPLVLIGPRSVLFSPLRSIGLIVVDEAHEPSYKQEQEPRYHANRFAAYLASAHKATMILGSATPSIVDYYVAKEKDRPIIRLESLAKPSEHKLVRTVVDLKNREHFTKSPHLSNPLIDSVADSLSNGEQTLLYLNRRGTARVSLCQNCGWQSVCPNCDLPLTYHGDVHRLRCHICNFSTTTPTTCPVCRHTDIIFKSVGTKAIVSEVTRLFPDAKIMRFDSDNTKDDRFENHYKAAVSGDIDILIGTQTLAKGLDLPLLSTLGVIGADSSLQMPDYTASERTYQLINQVLGRVQRGHRASRAIIQTYEPESTLLHAALEDNWPEFYQNEITEREAFMYPPFCFLLKITCRRASARSAEQACNKIKDAILASHAGIEVDGPAPAMHERFKETYTWQIVLKSKQRSELLTILDGLPSTVTSFDLDPVNLL
jgi:primosomal protein N' (replication factor Y)